MRNGFCWATGCARAVAGQLTDPCVLWQLAVPCYLLASGHTIVVVGKLAVPWLSLGSLVCPMCCWAAGCNMVIARQLAVHACWWAAGCNMVIARQLAVHACWWAAGCNMVIARQLAVHPVAGQLAVTW
jgi:hypothetical protein